MRAMLVALCAVCVTLSSCVPVTTTWVRRINVLDMESDVMAIGGELAEYSNGVLVSSTPFLRLCTIGGSGDFVCRDVDADLVVVEEPARPEPNSPGPSWRGF